MSKILLIGVVHNDLKIHERTKKALDCMQPDVLTAEVSAADIEFVQTHLRELLVKRLVHHVSRGLSPEAQNVFRSISEATAGEIFAALNYAQSHNVALRPVDDPRISLRANVENIPNTPIQELNQITLEPIQQRAAQAYAQTQEICDFPDLAFETQVATRVSNASRDEIAASHLTRLTQCTQGLIVHICGVAHMLDDELQRTLYAQLKSRQLDVSRVTVRYYDDRDQLTKEQAQWREFRKQLKK